MITDYFKPSSSNSSSSSSKPDAVEERRQEAQQKLDKKHAHKLEYNSIGPSWMNAVIEDEIKKPYFKKLKDFLAAESKSHKVFPAEDDIYSWTRHCEFSNVKVVIIGQDPYHNDGQANGLAFSVPAAFCPLPPSLHNIYKELAVDVPGFAIPKHGDLTKWAQQGVLLLNATLTVRAHCPASHARSGWDLFTDAIIKALSDKAPHPLVFILWGAHAQKKGAGIDSKRHCVLKSAHPSPLSADRGFFGCRHFSLCNKFLKEHGLTEIDWHL